MRLPRLDLRARLAGRRFVRADVLSVAGLAVVAVVVVGLSFFVHLSHRQSDDTIQTSATAPPPTGETTTTLFAQSPTSSTTTTMPTTTMDPSTIAPLVGVVSFDPGCGKYITVTVQVASPTTVESVAITAGSDYGALQSIGGDQWQVTIAVPQSEQFQVVATDVNGLQGSTGGTLSYC